MAASTIKPDNNSRERGKGATTLRRRLWDLSPGSLPLRSPRHLVKVLSHSVHDAFALVALAQLGQHHRWERKKKRAEEGNGLQADPCPSTETMPQSLREDSKATESSLSAWGLATLTPHASDATGRIFTRCPQTTWLDTMGLSDTQVLCNPTPRLSDSAGGPGSLQFFTFDNSFIEIEFLYHTVNPF